MKFNRLYKKTAQFVFPPNSRRRFAAKVLASFFTNPLAISRNVTRANFKKIFDYLNKDELFALEEKIRGRFRWEAVNLQLESVLIAERQIEVLGWAIAPQGIQKVSVFCNGIFLGDADSGFPSPSAQDAYPYVENSGSAGFYFFKSDVALEPDGVKAKIRVLAVTNDSRQVEAMQSVDLADQYARCLEPPSTGTRNWMRTRAAGFLRRPAFGIGLLLREASPESWKKTLGSLAEQAYPGWRLLLFGNMEGSGLTGNEIQAWLQSGQCRIFPEGPARSDWPCDWVGFLRPGDTLAPDALFEAAARLEQPPEVDLIYTDEDAWFRGEHQNHFFKPDWSPELLDGFNYIGRFFLASMELARRAGGPRLEFEPEEMTDWVLRLTESARGVAHIPKILFTRRESDLRSASQAADALQESVRRRGLAAAVHPVATGDYFRVERKIQGAPKISLLIPTAFKKPEMLEDCLRSIVERSTYPRYELILMDNSQGRLRPEDWRPWVPESVVCRQIPYSQPFNYSSVNNLAVRHATGEYLVFLNDDTVVQTPGWIEAMLEYAQQPETGVVGAKLLYPDNTLQHGGIFLVDTGGGGRHAFRFAPAGSGGYNGLLNVARTVSAVTFGCAMVSRALFDRLGGLDEHLKVECNDIDFCLRAAQAGYRNVWTPFAVLHHRELTTRVRINFVEDVQYHWRRWRSRLEAGDPYYNPNLTLDSDHYFISSRPVFHQHQEAVWRPEKGEESFLGAAAGEHPDQARRILLVQMGSLRETLASLPAVMKLRQDRPEAQIALLVGKGSYPAVRRVLAADRVLCFPGPEGMPGLGRYLAIERHAQDFRKELATFRFDLAMDLGNGPAGEALLELSGAILRLRAAQAKEAPRPRGLDRTHRSARILQELFALLPLDAVKPEAPLEMPPFRFEPMGEVLKRHPRLDIRNFWLGLHPGGASAIRRWPARHFSRLADLLVEREDAWIAVFGSRADQSLCRQVVSGMAHPERALNLSGRLSLDEYMVLSGQCRLLVGNDHGGTHLAGAVGVPVVVPFSGQRPPDEEQPVGPDHRSVWTGIACSPCYKPAAEACPYHLRCLKMLWPEKVYAAVAEVLAREKGRRA